MFISSYAARPIPPYAEIRDCSDRLGAFQPLPNYQLSTLVMVATHIHSPKMASLRTSSIPPKTESQEKRIWILTQFVNEIHWNVDGCCFPMRCCIHHTHLFLSFRLPCHLFFIFGRMGVNDIIIEFHGGAWMCECAISAMKLFMRLL